MMANAKCGSMTTRTWTFPCSRGCSTDAAAATKRSATRSCCPPALCPDGRSKCHCRSIRSGRRTTPPVSAGSFATGVDTPLANLFVHAARSSLEPHFAKCGQGSVGDPVCPRPGSPSPDAEGAARARSASEAFLYRRLETLPETAGHFRLNVELPIPFDGWGRMEVDLFCAEAGVVIELDGAQHLADAEAYRRDRRKDALLQQNGYFVLRFLAEDAGKRLDGSWTPSWPHWSIARRTGEGDARDAGSESRARNWQINSRHSVGCHAAMPGWIETNGCRFACRVSERVSTSGKRVAILLFSR